MAKNSVSLSLLPILLIAIVAFSVGALVMYLVSIKATTAPVPVAMTSSTPPADFFDGVTATAQGKVTDVSGDKITVQNKNDQTQSFKLSPTVFVSKSGQNGKLATASGEVAAIEKDKDVVMSLAMKDGEYVVMSVIYPVLPSISQPNP
jgi:hypothetical protein